MEQNNDPQNLHRHTPPRFHLGTIPRHDGQRVFFKIDYFDESLTYHPPDPADPAVTKRVITIMLAEEY